MYEFLCDKKKLISHFTKMKCEINFTRCRVDSNNNHGRYFIEKNTTLFK